MRSRRFPTITVPLLFVALAACGSDDPSTSADTTTPPAGADAPPVTDFCDAWTSLDMLDSPGGPTEPTPEDVMAYGELVTPLFERAVAAAPVDIADALEQLSPVVAEIQAGDASGIEDPEFMAANEVVEEAVRTSCDVASIDVTAQDYSFSMPTNVPAGPVSVRMANAGQEPHVLLFVRQPDELTDNVAFLGDYLGALFSGDPAAIAEYAALNVSGGGPFAVPGGSTTKVTDFEPGKYLYFCPIPKGNAPDGAPHFMLGMQGTFTVDG